MLKRPFKSLIARIAIVALALSLVVPFVPAAFAQDTSIDYAENGTGPVQTFTLSDQDGSSGSWSVGGRDAALFSISSDGALSFKKSPNFESPGDVGGDNTYNVTVSRAGGSLDVAINVTNVDEMGSVTLDDLQPQAGASVSVVSLSDPDGDTGETTWQWSKSMDEAAWSDISGATSSTYTPKSGDVGYYLRATATYSDGLGTGRDSASATTAFAVEARPAANSRPAFADDDDDVDGSQQDRSVNETAKVGSSVGNAVTATDADNDPLLYGLDAVMIATLDTADAADAMTDKVTIRPVGATDATGDVEVDASTLFTINNKTGQISVKSGANLEYLDLEKYEFTMKADGDDADTDLDTVPLAYDVQVTATDPSGSQATVTVTISVNGVNEAPGISRSDTAAPSGAEDRTTGGEFVVTTPEQVPLDLSGIASATAFEGLPVFDGKDPEGANDKITWSISGVDAKRFLIADIRPLDGDTDNDGELSQTEIDAWEAQTAEARATAIANSVGKAALRWSTSDGRGPSFEAMDSADGDNVYLVTVTASDGSSSKSQPVSITVVNREEDGEISLSQLQPQEGIAITARLSDQDGNITGTEWQWYRGNIDIGTFFSDNTTPPDGHTSGTQTVSTLRVNDNGTPDDLTDDGGANSAINATDSVVTNCVLTDAEKAGADGNVGTADDVSPSATCAINGATSSTYTPTAEDDGKKLHVRATYVDGFVTDVILIEGYTNTAALADDASDADRATAAEDDKTDGKDDGDVALATSRNAAEARPNENDLPSFGDDESVSRSVAENTKGASVGDPVTAVDDDVLQYSLSGDGSDDFKVSGGQITTAKELDFETKSSYTLTLTATDPSLASASITVNITVTDADDPATIVPATENNAPVFADESVTLSVDENSEAGTAVGDPITATDADGQDITYTLDDSSVVEIWPSGQLTVAEGANLDYEGETNSYTVVLTASDGVSGSSITVTINLNNVGLDTPYDVDDNGEISKDEAVAAADDYFLDNITREEVLAVIALYFG